MKPSSSVIFENNFVNIGDLGKLCLTFGLKNDRLGNN